MNTMVRQLLTVATVLCWPACPLLASDKPASPQEAPKKMTLPKGFQATLFAGEPDVVQPIAFTFDDRGRLWVVECNSYPTWTKNKEGNDRVLIFEDKGDGHFDKCSVFWDKGANLTGIEYGFGGIWLCSTPNLIFIPIKEGDDKPSGPPQIMLDGWDLTAKHNVFNSLTWGPDGWLYGCNGILSNSRVAAPGSPDDKRVALNCGVWRYHPTRKIFEVVAHGTTNPWGLDFDDYGRMFITNCVIKHLFHVIPGAHYERMFGQDINPYSYGLMQSCADHIHWAGGDWTSSRGGKGEHSDKGGGHAHSGAMVYLGDNWPHEYRNNVFMCNIHGNRINRDIIEDFGSGVVARHGKDFLFANDEWFRGITLKYGPDGGVYITDWCDTGECHNYVEVDRTNGRIYKITYGKPKPFTGDLAKLSDEELVKLQGHKNDWFVRHARRLLQERAVAEKLDKAARTALQKVLSESKDTKHRLRALWALHVTGRLEEAETLTLLDEDSADLSAWAIQLALETGKPSSKIIAKLSEIADEELGFAPALLAVASGLQRLPLDNRWQIAECLVRKNYLRADSNFPLMVWYGIEPLIATDTSKAISLIEKAEIPLVRESIARRIASVTSKNDEASKTLVPLVNLLAETKNKGVKYSVLKGMLEALKGRRQLPMPPNWTTSFPLIIGNAPESVEELTLRLGALFDDEKALKSLRDSVLDKRSPAKKRLSALETLIFKQQPDLLAMLKQLISDKDLRGEAIRGMAAFHDSDIPKLLIDHYASFTDSEKSDVVQTLASRPSYAVALLDAIEKGEVRRTDVSAYTARQMVELKNAKVTDRLAKVWGAVRSTSQEKAAQMSKYKSMLNPDFLKSADLTKGRLVFSKTCATCHRLFNEGAKVGPELTGSQRANVQYVLENVIDPSAIVAKEFQMTVVELKNGRVISGIIKDENDQAVTIQTQNEAIILPKKEIDSRNQSPVSMMPEGLLDKLSNEEVRDLVGYLASPAQVPLPKNQTQ
jgi:putative membrane-bound dehydrogenase-like protein